ncbi:LacI family DNA-binding transcriptional regulator [Streptomyces iconiensis]|uniref:LacI family DNA-binding transcriptional regulator n=1 Tax=Streptomyces iconiensis TaxID=1384038 RepID=A0ABT6ZTP1_9ACTN|nr:LacI family DNA-binding transcriptional regulator [Streptomyces iconiensis]MDJ1132222.1 LacI family DNA-binding transcriptional regulator [Streptomyces iconiensis]
MPEARPGGPGTPGRTRPTGHDVASAAGVSQATVSLVLGGKWEGRVSARTAQKVREAAREMGYRPNLAARHLRLGRTRTALLVVPALTNEFFAAVHQGAVGIASDHDFGLLLYPSPEGVTAAPVPFASASAALDGVIASSMAPGALSALRGEGLPLVMLDSDDPGSDATVNFDIAHGMRQIAGHLLSLGHRHLAHVASAIDSWTFTTRADSLHQALHGTGGSVVRTEHAPLSVAGGLEATTRALTGTTAPAPTAVVCDDDLLATGALKAARRLGLRVPEDVSVTGFDDLALATAVEPELTTVHLPAAEAGAAGMRALLAVLDGRQADTELLPVTLVPRTSTGPPATAAR